MHPSLPNGTEGPSRLIQDGIQRMRWRGGAQQKAPTLMQPGTVYKISVSLWNTSFVFQAGHRIRTTVASANAPRFWPNPNTGRSLLKQAAESPRATVVAQNSVYFSADRPSALHLPVVTLDQLPKHNILSSAAGMAEEAAAAAEARGHARAGQQSAARVKATLARWRAMDAEHLAASK